ncbi:MAG: hypothetical protein NW203_08445 [Hyphomonadaceae bacterium]|nr:hypothetical protein [Hyphomonadaceae bacterium]
MIPDARNPLQSLTLRSAALAVIAYAAARMGVVLPDGAAATLADAAFDLLFALSMIGIGVGRARARAPLA